MKRIHMFFAVAALALLAAGCNKNSNQPAPTPTPSPVSNTETNTSVLGDPQAPVTIVEYGHFKCPFCNRFFRETESQIVDKYIKTGKAKFIWKDFPYEGEDSGRASEAAYCAGDQGKFWEFHDSLFKYIWDSYYSKGINAEEITVFTDSKLNELSGQIGLDVEKFGNCLTSGKYTQLVKSNYEAGIAEGVKSTPTFFINGQKIVGAQPFSIFDQIIQSKLK